MIKFIKKEQRKKVEEKDDVNYELFERIYKQIDHL